MSWQDTYDGKRKLWLNEHGICRDCGQRDVQPNTQLCFECAERKYKKAAEYYEKNKEKIKQQNRERGKQRYAERKLKGICTKCGKRKSIQNKTLCLDCYIKKHRKKDPRWNNEIERSERPEYGLCYVCASPLTSHHSFCDKCLERSRELMIDLNKNPTLKMEEWREKYSKENDFIFNNK